MKIALLGYGKMGRTIEALAQKAGHRVVHTQSSSESSGNLALADVAIEFSTPETAVDNIIRCFERKTPVVSGTTGWLDRYEEVLKKREDCNGSFIYASNFSVGVNLFFKLNEYLAKLMSSWSQYDVSVEEIHHTQKKDAPSGTAISIAERILKHARHKKWELAPGSKDALQISALRKDDVKGTHRIDYVSEIDSIRIEHEAHTRDGFAMGALLAAEWLIGKKGVFTMDDVLQINE